MSSPTVFSGVHVAISLIFYVLFCILLFVFFTYFFLTIVLSVHLRLTGSDYPFGIFNIFFQNCHFQRTNVFQFLAFNENEIKSGLMVAFECLAQKQCVDHINIVYLVFYTLQWGVFYRHSLMYSLYSSLF